jgi:cellulose synthase/poly-beta-1,6-N-acetylglucosamine synthase-like glycosyltransferase
MYEKPMESFLGYIHILPGSFSAIRYERLKKHDKREVIRDH